MYQSFIKLSYIYPMQFSIGLAMKLNYIFDYKQLFHALDFTQKHLDPDQKIAVLNLYKTYLNHARETVYDNIYNDKDITKFMELEDDFCRNELKATTFDKYQNDVEVFDFFDLKLCSLDSYEYMYCDNLRQCLVH